jgi:hypothetical protein
MPPKHFNDAKTITQVLSGCQRVSAGKSHIAVMIGAFAQVILLYVVEKRNWT